MFYVSSNEVKAEVILSTHWDAGYQYHTLVTLYFYKPSNDSKLNIFETTLSGDSLSVVSIFKITDQQAEEDNEEGVIIRESISKIELSRGDWVPAIPFTWKEQNTKLWIFHFKTS